MKVIFMDVNHFLHQFMYTHVHECIVSCTMGGIENVIVIRGVGRGGSKGSDKPPFQARFLKNYSYCYFKTNNIKHYNF